MIQAVYLSSLDGAANRRALVRAARAAKPSRIGRARGAVRTPRMTQPLAAERGYLRTIMRVLERWEDLIIASARAELPAIAAEAALSRPTLDSVRLDAWGDRLRQLIDSIRAALAGLVTDAELERLAHSIAADVASLNAVEFSKLTRAVLSVDVFASEPWLEPELQAFSVQNAALIKGIGEARLDEVRRIIFDGFRTGLRQEAIADQLVRSRLVRSEKRAAFIARDQVSSLNGHLGRLRATQAGLDEYYWRGVLDERERPEHLAREGKAFRWDEPPADGNPGQPPLCRCYGEPKFDAILAAIDGGDEA